MANKKSYNRWWLILTIALASIPLLLFFGFGGWVAGEEFSPDDFSRRRFSYNVMPLFGITLRSVRYSDSTPVFEQSLDEDLIGKARPIKKWHLISDYQFSLDYWFTSSAPSPDFDAGLLCGVLDIKDENNESIWINWNQDHPDLAKELWPIAADMALSLIHI